MLLIRPAVADQSDAHQFNSTSRCQYLSKDRLVRLDACPVHVTNFVPIVILPQRTLFGESQDQHLLGEIQFLFWIPSPFPSPLGGNLSSTTIYSGSNKSNITQEAIAIAEVVEYHLGEMAKALQLFCTQAI